MVSVGRDSSPAISAPCSPPCVLLARFDSAERPNRRAQRLWISREKLLTRCGLSPAPYGVNRGLPSINNVHCHKRESDS